MSSRLQTVGTMTANHSVEHPLNLLQREDLSHTDQPVVGDDFLVKFLQKYELEEDMKMLLEMPANGATEISGKNDVSQAPSPELVFFEVSDLKLDAQEGAKASLGSERDRDGVRESRADKTLRKTRRPARKQVFRHHKKKRNFLQMVYETIEEVKSCEELVSNMLHALK